MMPLSTSCASHATITPLRDEAGLVSHEPRTPFTSIRGSLGLIQGALASSLPAPVRDLLAIAQSNCERLVLVVDDILDIEKLSAGQMRFDIQTLPLAASSRPPIRGVMSPAFAVASSKSFPMPILRRRANKAAPGSACTSRAVSSNT